MMPHKMVLTPLNYTDLSYIAHNMRDADRMEIFATRWSDSPQDLVNDGMSPIIKQFAWIAGKERPIAAIGAFPVWPGVYNIWMFGTNEFQDIGLPLSKFVVKEFMPKLKAMGHRGQCFSQDTHEDAHRWLEMTGGVREGVAKGYGKHGEDFYLYAWQGRVPEPIV